jgi:hypothetical protein
MQHANAAECLVLRPVHRREVSIALPEVMRQVGLDERASLP